MKILNVTKVDPNQYDKDDINIIGLREKEPDKWSLGPWDFIINMNGVFTVWKNHKLIYQAQSSDHFDKVKFYPNGIEYNITIMDAPKVGIGPQPVMPGSPPVSNKYTNTCCGNIEKNSTLVINKGEVNCQDTYGNLSGTYTATWVPPTTYTSNDGYLLFTINSHITIKVYCASHVTNGETNYNWEFVTIIDGVPQSGAFMGTTGTVTAWSNVTPVAGDCLYTLTLNPPNNKKSDVHGAGVKTSDGITELATDPVVGITISLAENTVSGGPTKSNLGWTNANYQKSDTLTNWVDQTAVGCSPDFSNYARIANGNVWVTYWYIYLDPSTDDVSVVVWLYDSTHGIDCYVIVPITGSTHTATFSGSNYSFVATISTVMGTSSGGGGD